MRIPTDELDRELFYKELIEKCLVSLDERKGDYSSLRSWFLFGAGRGLLLCVVAFIFFNWLVPDKQRPEWVTNAKSKTVLQGTGDWLVSLLPDDPENTILKRFKKNKPDEDQGEDQQPAPGGSDGYSKPARDSLKKLIEGKPAAK